LPTCSKESIHNCLPKAERFARIDYDEVKTCIVKFTKRTEQARGNFFKISAVA
jgi:hypothetical protein